MVRLKVILTVIQGPMTMNAVAVPGFDLRGNVDLTLSTGEGVENH